MWDLQEHTMNYAKMLPVGRQITKKAPFPPAWSQGLGLGMHTVAWISAASWGLVLMGSAQAIQLHVAILWKDFSEKIFRNKFS